jgi:NAD(P)-dependent dehydrogenase (short-subunit alcohol dehydrogenase family)
MADLASFPPDGVAVVYGASGAIGRSLVVALQAQPAFRRVIGFARRGDSPIDLLDESSLVQAAEYAAAAGDIRLAIDATGFLHDATQAPEKTWRELDPAHLARSFALNATGPALIMKHLLPRLPATGKSAFATLSARVGSIGDNQLGGWYGYRASKAALNQFVRTAAVELRRRRPEAICVALHPGTVASGLSAPFAKSGLDVQSPSVAAGRLLAVVDGLAAADSGGFFDHRGQAVPW